MLAVLSFALDFVGLLGGYSLFIPQVPICAPHYGQPCVCVCSWREGLQDAELLLACNCDAQVSLLQILAHFIGGICVSAFIAQEWHYETMWAIVGTCNIPTALVEIGVLFCIFVSKTILR